ncbi:glycerophosphoryl diester phosphodiesterase membrane domain-containing protein [Microbacterium sp. NPDC076911]|uniref:glycerophosphoryl diester phosphodiesterase membrane domain-containing protein n=1 Tax=Microbacterium sp. NPDC076911 TaxID=3154958 RepID=UPI00341C9DC9
MTAYPAWTPASRPGIIPLHPLTFGTILGRSFAALRQNPRVLLGFALVAQAVAYIVLTVAVGAVAWLTFSRLDTVTPGSDDFNAILAGSITITAIAALLLGLAVGALTIVVQAVVIAEVAHAAVAEKLSLGALWRQIKPVIGRLLAYTALMVIAVIVLVAVLGGAILALGLVAAPLAVGVGILVALATIPLAWWLGIKLLLVPAAIIIEHQSIGKALSRSWVLTRRRFWRTLGLLLVVSLIFGTVSQVISFPLGLLSSAFTSIIAPTGDPDASAIIAIVVITLFAQILTLLIQSVALVVQSTATAIIYIDARMQREGLDLDLLAYIEHRDAGATGLTDPYRQHIGREVEPRLPVNPYALAPASAPGADAQQYPPQPPYPAPPQPPQSTAPPQVPAAPASPPPASSPTTWAAPGASAASGDKTADPKSPWS